MPLVDNRAKNLLALEAILVSLAKNLVQAKSGTTTALKYLVDRDTACQYLHSFSRIDGTNIRLTTVQQIIHCHGSKK